jgi:hypothetical protein
MPPAATGATPSESCPLQATSEYAIKEARIAAEFLIVCISSTIPEQQRAALRETWHMRALEPTLLRGAPHALINRPFIGCGRHGRARFAGDPFLWPGGNGNVIKNFGALRV